MDPGIEYVDPRGGPWSGEPGAAALSSAPRSRRTFEGWETWRHGAGASSRPWEIRWLVVLRYRARGRGSGGRGRGPRVGAVVAFATARSGATPGFRDPLAALEAAEQAEYGGSRLAPTGTAWRSTWSSISRTRPGRWRRSRLRSSDAGVNIAADHLRRGRRASGASHSRPACRGRPGTSRRFPTSGSHAEHEVVVVEVEDSPRRARGSDAQDRSGWGQPRSRLCRDTEPCRFRARIDRPALRRCASASVSRA